MIAQDAHLGWGSLRAYRDESAPPLIAQVAQLRPGPLASSPVASRVGPGGDGCRSGLEQARHRWRPSSPGLVRRPASTGRRLIPLEDCRLGVSRSDHRPRRYREGCDGPQRMGIEPYVGSWFSGAAMGATCSRPVVALDRVGNARHVGGHSERLTDAGSVLGKAVGLEAEGRGNGLLAEPHISNPEISTSHTVSSSGLPWSGRCRLHSSWQVCRKFWSKHRS